MCYIALSFNQITNCAATAQLKPKAMTKQISVRSAELYDIDKQISGGQFRAAATKGNWVAININDFVGWLFETGRIDNYHTNGEGMVEFFTDDCEYDTSRAAYVTTAKGSVQYSFQEFLSDCITDGHIISYLNSQDGFEAWVARATAQAAPARPAQEYTPEQEAQMWAEYYEED